MSNSLTIGGTANFRAIDETSFSVAMTGTFDGGVYAKVVGSEELPDGKIRYDLRHYFTADDGSYVNTQDKSVHTPPTRASGIAPTATKTGNLPLTA